MALLAMKTRFLAVLLSLLLLAACGGQAAPASSPSSPPAGSAAAPASGASAKPASASGAAAAKPSGQATKLVASYGELVPQSLPVWFAKDSGIFEQNGLDVDLRLIVSSAEVAALVAGDTQLASSGGPIVLSAVSAGADLVVTAGIAVLSPFALYTPPSINSVPELKGKALGVSKFGSPSDIALKIALRKFGIDPSKDVRFVELGSTQARTAALIQGTIQGGMANPLEANTLEKNGLHAIYDMAKDKQPSAQSVIVSKRDWVAGHRDVMQRYIDSIAQTMIKVRQDKPRAIAVMKRWFKSDDEQLMTRVYDQYTSTGLWPTVPSATPEMFADAKEIISATDPKMKDYDLSKLIDSSFVKSAEERGLTKG